jgi:hypothetical protein
MGKDGRGMQQPTAVGLAIKSCGEKHTDHDWGQDGRCRRCGARWTCPPHWWLVDEGKCRFCPAKIDGLTLKFGLDEIEGFRRMTAYRDHPKGEKLA